MASGQRRRRGGSGGEACPRRISRFLEPCLLLLLHCTETHGYELIEELKPLGFEQNPVDLSTVYRMLRSLEERDLVTSRWDTDTESGPARRLYRITPEGEGYLAWWMDDLRETRRVLERFAMRYEHHMAQHEEEP